jgi:hypothetical protein
MKPKFSVRYGLGYIFLGKLEHEFYDSKELREERLQQFRGLNISTYVWTEMSE